MSRPIKERGGLRLYPGFLGRNEQPSDSGIAEVVLVDFAKKRKALGVISPEQTSKLAGMQKFESFDPDRVPNREQPATYIEETVAPLLEKKRQGLISRTATRIKEAIIGKDDP